MSLRSLSWAHYNLAGEPQSNCTTRLPWTSDTRTECFERTYFTYYKIQWIFSTSWGAVVCDHHHLIPECICHSQNILSLSFSLSFLPSTPPSLPSLSQHLMMIIISLTLLSGTNLKDATPRMYCRDSGASPLEVAYVCCTKSHQHRVVCTSFVAQVYFLRGECFKFSCSSWKVTY